MNKRISKNKLIGLQIVAISLIACFGVFITSAYACGRNRGYGHNYNYNNHYNTTKPNAAYGHCNVNNCNLTYAHTHCRDSEYCHTNNGYSYHHTVGYSHSKSKQHNR